MHQEGLKQPCLWRVPKVHLLQQNGVFLSEPEMLKSVCGFLVISFDMVSAGSPFSK